MSNKNKELYCSPDIKENTITCYSKKDLVFLIKSYNKHKEKKDNISGLHRSKNELWLELNKKLSKDCKTEWCWLRQKFVPESYGSQKLKETFKPEMPPEWKNNPYEWLSTTDIKYVMKQYEKRYPSFLFLGPVPVDCPASITCVLSGLSVEKLINALGKTKIGIIYNLDKHDQPGSHWVAAYLDFKKARILYFDSVGMKPPNLILSFLKKMKEDCENYYLKYLNKHKSVSIYSNKTRFQFGNSECGVFSMYFIISNLKNNITMDRENINDTIMNNLRKKYYRPSS